MIKLLTDDTPYYVICEMDGHAYVAAKFFIRQSAEYYLECCRSTCMEHYKIVHESEVDEQFYRLG